LNPSEGAGKRLGRGGLCLLADREKSFQSKYFSYDTRGSVFVVFVRVAIRATTCDSLASYPLLDFLADLQECSTGAEFRLLYDTMANRFSCTGAGHYAADPRVIVVHPNNPTVNYAKSAEMSRLNSPSARSRDAHHRG